MKVAAVGMFDGVHLGHRYLLSHLRREAESRGGEAVVVTFPNHPLEVVAPERAPLLLSPGEEKTELLSKEGVGVELMDFNRELMMTSSRDFLAMLKRDFGVGTLLLGFNNRFGHDRIDSFEDYRALGREMGVEIIRGVEFNEGEMKISSSAVRRLLEKGDVEGASALLGRQYEVRGDVVHGKQLGRTIGFPTANIEVPDPERKLIPLAGVYAAKAVLDNGVECAAMVNIGHRPTVDRADSPVTIEVNLIDYDRAHLGDRYEGSLYGTKMRILFLKRLRDERRFASLEELKQQLEADRVMALGHYSERGKSF